jgi:hypothetical protein
MKCPHLRHLAICLVALALGPASIAAAPPEQPADPAARLAAKLEKHRKKYGERMLYEVDEKLKILFVMGTDQRMLDEVKQRLSAHAEALQRDLFKHGLKDYLSVIVPRKWANPKVTGHFYPDWIDAATIGTNLMHEFTHALHYADQVGRDEYQPVWLMEGFASMYEDSKVVDGHAVPLVNRRIIELQQEVRNKKFLPLEKMMKLERRQFTSHHYAQARYICMWIQASGHLPKWYATYTAGFAEDASGVVATEKVFGRRIAELDNDWVAWLLKQEQPKVVLGPGSAGLGIGTKQAPDGIEITQLAPQGAAEMAGLAIGDILIHIAGQRVIEMETLFGLLGSHKVGDSVKIEYRRDGKYAETTARLTPLGAAAATPPAGTKPAG